MSNLSIYQTSWINLVFEDRNKEYGAYQLRKDSVKTTISALFYAFILVILMVSFPLFLNFINGSKNANTIAKDIPKMPKVVIFNPKKIDVPKKAFVPPSKTPVNKSAAKATMSNPIVVDRTNESPVVPKNSDPTTNTSTSSANPSENGSGEPSSSSGTSGTSGTNETGTKIGVSTILDRSELDKNPEFPGGIKVFLNYVGLNFKTPEIEMEQTVKVYVSFVVEIDGSMSNIQVENDPGFGLGKEAVRVLKSVKTKWQPGQKEGQKVRTFYNLPISVELK